MTHLTDLQAKARALLPELEAKLPDVNAVEWRDYRVVSKYQLETLIAILQAFITLSEREGVARDKALEEAAKYFEKRYGASGPSAAAAIRALKGNPAMGGERP